MEAGTVLLDFDGVSPGPLTFSRPRAVVAAQTPDEVRPALAAVDRAAAAGRWAAGFVAYEAGPALDPALRARTRGALPLVWFGVYDGPDAARPEPRGDATLAPLAPDVDRGAYAASVARIRERIARGDVYQVNHTFRLRGRFEGDPLALYLRLREAQGGGLGALVHLGERAIVSASPELFLERTGDLVRTRPMKGTARRGRFEEEDAAAAAALAASPKERAENVMIADLLRNDLGRVARTGSVRVARLLDVERYRTIFQLTSTIEARLADRVGTAALLAATFPCGSVTGAPKAMATRIIAAEEGSPRGAYCGAIGFVAPGGDAAFNVAIRTVELDLAGGEAVAGVGGGITWESSADAEWEEALAKAAFLTARVPAFELLETMRLEIRPRGEAALRSWGPLGGEIRPRGEAALLGWGPLRGEAGGFPLAARHLARLGASARHLGFRLDAAAVEAALRDEAAAAGAPRRVRLLVRRDGGVRVESDPLPPAPDAPLPVAPCRARVARADPLLFHKTTLRERYEAARRERPDAFDVLLSNEDGDPTECTIGNLVVELDGERVTPPVAAGLLPGVMRAELLARREVRERPVRAEDLERARRLWLVNAVRGWVPVWLRR
jgi:para-aminobenzoate synthetase / 4-amino-4-deoxychorismate lyase